MSVTLLVKQIGLEDQPLPHRQVKSLHGETGQMRWQHSREEAITYITSQLFHYYFKKDGRAVRIVLDRQANGEPFLKAETDGDVPGALLQLPLIQPRPLQPAAGHE